MMFDLAFIWAGLIAFAVLAYVILDGFDLGVGILFPLMRTEADKDLAMNTVAPVWDGNETWLVLGGGGLFAVFPLAYAVVMPALYVPIIVMLLALVFRGVAFEFRWRTKRGKFLWDISFFGGSLMAAFAQGVALGALVQGIAVEDRAYAGGNWDWLTPFSLLTGVALVAGYALLGATWLVMKTDGPVRAAAHRLSWWTGGATLGLVGLVSLITPFLNPALSGPLVRLPERALQFAGAGGDPGGGVPVSKGACARTAMPGPSLPRSRCSCSASSGWGSASIPSWCRRR
jgi:cytochrome bd ubiquinol oxidase subunit II